MLRGVVMASSSVPRGEVGHSRTTAGLRPPSLVLARLIIRLLISVFVEPPLGRRLYLGHRAVHDVLDQRLQAKGASLWNWVLLREATRASGASQRELADLMHIEPPLP